MQFIDRTFPTPEQNLALDEALLDWCDQNPGHETLRFWESSTPFVVLGYSGKVQAEVFPELCTEKNIPILRRSSGGGTVLQGPGCLNYALILQIPKTGPLRHLTQTNAFIMEQHQKALQSLTPSKIQVQGITDLTLNGLKFSGNAQRRKRNALLFHGTLLYDFDLKQIQTLLPLPERQPKYRDQRPHQDFLTQFPVSRDKIQQALQEVWQAHTPLEGFSFSALEDYVQKKYTNKDWNFKF